MSQFVNCYQILIIRCKLPRFSAYFAYRVTVDALYLKKSIIISI